MSHESELRDYVVLRYCRNGMYAGSPVLIKASGIIPALHMYIDYLQREVSPEMYASPDIGRSAAIIEGDTARFRRAGETDHYEIMVKCKLGSFLDPLGANPFPSALNLN